MLMVVEQYGFNSICCYYCSDNTIDDVGGKRRGSKKNFEHFFLNEWMNETGDHNNDNMMYFVCLFVVVIVEKVHKFRFNCFFDE